LEIKPAGLTIGAGATFILQGTANANGDDLAKNGEDVTDASYSMDLEFEKTFDDYGVAFLHLETGDGAGVEDELKVFSNVNRELVPTKKWLDNLSQKIGTFCDNLYTFLG